ncbi:hypothetical protein PFISCL1PPCAC_13167, partial [Pristionchus fissidentatus]
LQTSRVIHIATLNEGVSRCGQIEILIKSILLFHKGVIHMHIFADRRSREMLSVMFSTWQLENVRWSLYEMESVHDGVRWLPSMHHSGTIGVFKFFPDDLLPRFVEKIILIDSDTILLDDIQSLHDHFVPMDEQGAFWATSEDQYRRDGYREIYPHKDNQGENNGILLMDLKKMREIGDWNRIWKNETFSLYQKVGPLVASDQDVFTSLAFWFPQWHYRLPCVYNFQMGDWAIQSQCVGEFRDFSVVKIAHWTEGKKWDGTLANVKFFTQIYRCIQKIDGGIFGIHKSRENSTLRRTLHYIKDAEKTPQLSDLTLATHAHFNQSFPLIDHLSQWPGPVALAVYGSDEQRMLLTNFLHANAKLMSGQLAIHFVHPAVDDSKYPVSYLSKIVVDSARTDSVLLAYDIDELDVSENIYLKLTNHLNKYENDFISLIRSRKGAEVIGAVIKKPLAQLMITKDLSAEEAVHTL